LSADRLVYMANQIALFFRSQPTSDAVAATADHLHKFWEPRMRRQIVDLLASGKAAGLADVAREAVLKLPEAAGAAADRQL
jgi:formate dehydrogenase subunit delta